MVPSNPLLRGFTVDDKSDSTHFQIRLNMESIYWELTVERQEDFGRCSLFFHFDRKNKAFPELKRKVEMGFEITPSSLFKTIFG